jgi:hypothetical protein
MKIKIRPDDTSLVRDHDWLQMDGWPAGLRDDGRTGPAGDRHAQPARGSDPRPDVLAEAAARAEAPARAVAVHGGGTVAAGGGSRDPGRAAGGYLPVGLPEPGWHR